MPLVCSVVGCRRRAAARHGPRHPTSPRRIEARDVNLRDTMHDTALLQAAPQAVVLRPRQVLRSLDMT